MPNISREDVKVNQNGVPVVVDSIKRRDDFRMVRCNYLTVQCDAPSPDWQLSLRGEPSSFLMLGLVGIIRQPFGGNSFDSPDSIETTLDRFEERPELFIDVDDLWIPEFVLRQAETDFALGDVFRIGDDLFSAAFRYREGQLEQDDLLETCEQHLAQAEYSRIESAAFRAWHWQQVEAARRHYHENEAEGRVLQRKPSPDEGPSA